MKTATITNFKKNEEAVKIVITLVIFVFAAALAIVFTNSKTHGKIIEREKEAQAHSLSAVLSDGSEKIADSIDGFGRFYREIIDGKTVGFAFLGEAKGYSGKIRFFCGINPSGKVKGLSIISQSETPGLGTRVLETISSARFPMGLFQEQEDAEPWFSQQFRGISAVSNIGLNKGGEWHTLPDEAKKNLLKNNQITVITGSTITTSAITNELSARAKLLIFLLNNKEEETAPEQTGDYENGNGENEDD